MNDIRPPTLTYAQVAALTHRSVSTIERWVATNFIPYHRIGRSVRFYPAEIRRWMEEQEFDSDGNSPSRPLKKRPGAQYVYPTDTLGDEFHCWCGDTVDHDWPGKNRGAPHPHDHEGTPQVVVVQHNEETPEPQRIERGDMRGFHATLKAFLTQAVNTDGLRWRPTRNSVLLYPPDGSQPVSVFCRNNDQQVRSLETWYAAHVTPYLSVSDAVLEDLANTVNDPSEHPVREADPEVDLSTWEPYITTEGVASEWFVTDGHRIWCKACIGTETDYRTTTENVRGIGGHIRMVHRPTENLRTPEAQEKSVDSRRYNRLQEKVSVAVELLAETIGIEFDSDKVAAMQAEVDRLRTDLAREKKRADDAEARIKLLNEAFRGLS